ncbi:DUF4435 domain-containing protein [Rhizobium leguminosarum]|nr:DUF4435 domain-containing protein [Rhizobium leguminosarum]
MKDDDYADYLLTEASSDVAAIHEFLILYKEGSSELHLFFEGDEDSLFYVPEIRRRANGNDIYQYDCGGKRNVVAARNFIDENSYDCSCLYFIDRDFDDYLSSQADITENTYITDGYSIENSICHDDAVIIVVQDLLKIKSSDPDYANIVEEIQQCLESFRKACRPLIAWIIAAKEAGLSPNLRNTKGLHRVVSINDDGSSHINTEGFTYFKRQVLGVAASPPFRSVLQWHRLLDMEEHQRWLRGKYIYWFFPVAIVHLAIRLNTNRAVNGRTKIRIPSSFRSGHLFECMGGRIPPPTSLSSFFDRHLN